MDMELFIPRIVESDYALDRALGGTDRMSVNSASTKVGWVRRSALGVSGGVANLGSTAKLPVACVPGGEDGIHAVTIGSVATAYELTSNTFKITNYDSFITYTVTATSGTVSIDGDTITYIPVNENGTGGFYVNGEYFPITVVARRPETPTITSPVDGSTGVGSSVNPTSSAFAMNGAEDTHLSSDWQISTSPTFATIVAEVVDSTTNKTSWSYEALNVATNYYIRVRYKGANFGYSDWSAAINFTTKTSFVPLSEQKKFTPSDAAYYDEFGASVSISSNGDTVIVGCPGKRGRYGDADGAAYVFVRSGNTWTQQQKLTNSDLVAGRFGHSVAISQGGNTVAVGAPYGNYTGSAYIFTRSNGVWTQQAKVTPADGSTSDRFGFAVELSSDGNRLVVGSENHGGGNGAAYIFNRSGTTWTQAKKYTAPDNAAASRFGGSVSVSADGTVVAVGAPYQSSSAGAVYIHRLVSGTWGAAVKIKPAEITASNSFGESICISGDKNTIIIGAPGQATSKGASYIFAYESNAWVQKNKTVGGAANVNHGTRVQLSNDGGVAIVGTPQYGITGNGNTWVLLRSGDSWVYQSSILASDPEGGSYFGWAAAISSDGSTICIGAPRRNGSTGSAYIFV